VGRALTVFNYRVCVGQDYFKNHSAIKKPSDLQGHNCFVYSYFQGKNIWPLDEGMAIEGTLRVNSTIYMMQAIKQNLGIGFIPEFVCQPDIQSGKVVEILKKAKKPKLTLYALYPARHFVPAKLVQCIEFLEKWFSEEFK
jgi:DNA-binding transcriptional LysR family regulator